MRVLLDTHVFLWLQTDPARLGEVSDTLAEERSELFVSAASAWEIAIKYGLGRLPLPEPPIRYVTSRTWPSARVRSPSSLRMPPRWPTCLPTTATRSTGCSWPRRIGGNSRW
jgi:hypothetical protein